MVDWTAVATLASRQHGVVARRQLLELGVSGRTLAHRVEAGGWKLAHRGVYVLPGAADSFEQRTMAAVLANGPVALASHLTAAYLYGLLPGPPPVVDVLLPAACRSRKLPDVHVTRSRTLCARDRTAVGAIPATSPARTIIDLASVLEPPGLRAMVIDARQRRVVTMARILTRLADLGPVRGSGDLRRILWELDAERCDSVLEARVRQLLRKAGLPRPEPAPVPVRAGGRTLHVDIGWPQQRVGLEVDGFAWHQDRRALDRDQRRHNALVLVGWKVLRVGWGRLEEDTAGFLRELRLLLTGNVGA